MVQVDVFWSYSLGAGFALAAHQQIRKASQNTEREFLPWQAPWYVKMLLWQSIFFVPSGICLLWGFPSWETMHVGSKDMPTWIVTLFAITNMTQALLGYWLAQRAIMAGKSYRAFLHYVFGYFMLFFILVHGWDGTGYQRFFSPDKADLAVWTWATAGRWVTSNVALTLYGMGVIMLPILFVWMGQYIRDGIIDEGGKAVSVGSRVVWILLISFVGILASAIVASLMIHALGWWIGVPLFLILFWFLGLREQGYLGWMYRKLMQPTGAGAGAPSIQEPNA